MDTFFLSYILMFFLCLNLCIIAFCHYTSQNMCM